MRPINHVNKNIWEPKTDTLVAQATGLSIYFSLAHTTPRAQALVSTSKKYSPPGPSNCYSRRSFQ